ncbi:84_t:CDS:2 [Scutellospora calospora]|uniref:84_t:CDS:1 n=1 Tax=Scutellospora calospora TaxID=85575 RepID=A0ACA9JUH8_9GLOM|nr:84_t:CDS:2 [Scutellospora calospora]
MHPYLEVGKQLCHPHYCKLVEPYESKSKKQHIQQESNTFASSIEMLTKALYNQQRRECSSLELDLVNFERMIESINPGLKGFFSYITDVIIPKERSAYNINEAKKSVVELCYLIAGLRNKFVNQHKLEVGFYLRASGATWEAIDTMSSLGYSACAKTVETYQKKIQKEHSTKIENYFLEHNNWFHVYNIDDYHSIHENRRPDTVSTSMANHFATCIAKPIIDYTVSIVFNGVSIHNPANVEAPRICWHLLNRYTGIFDISYLDYGISQGRYFNNNFDPIEMLTIHNYADNIEERRCIHCEQFYKKGIFKNVQKFLNRIEKGANILTKEDLEDDEEEVEIAEEKSEEVEILEISNKLLEEINRIEYW